MPFTELHRKQTSDTPEKRKQNLTTLVIRNLLKKLTVWSEKRFNFNTVYNGREKAWSTIESIMPAGCFIMYHLKIKEKKSEKTLFI